MSKQALRAGIAAALAAAAFGASPLVGVAPPIEAGPVESPHGPYALASDSCAGCHRAHAGQGRQLLAGGESQSVLCFSCHDGTGASSDIASEYYDPNIPPDDPATASFYSHSAGSPSAHSGGMTDEFAGVLNRHAECGDCHNPHTVSAAAPAPTDSGWTASGALAAISGVSSSLAWTNPISYEYELCLKCHSRYTQLLSYAQPSFARSDKQAEFDPASGSYHPIEAAGTNSTAAMESSLAGGELWQFTTTSTIRCGHCHGDYRLLGDPPSPNDPPSDARLSLHTSQNRGLLIASYRDRGLKASAEPYSASDFALCFLCHGEAPFSDASGAVRTDTNFPYHGLHLDGIAGVGSGGLDIDTAGAGQGNAVCAECHFRTHGTASAYWPSDRDNQRLVNFAPNVMPVSGSPEPDWSLADRSCTLVCHGKTHAPEGY